MHSFINKIPRKGPFFSVFVFISIGSLSYCKKSSSGDDLLKCENPACSDKLELFRMLKDKNVSKSMNLENSSESFSTLQKFNQPEKKQTQNLCPLDKNELGNISWQLLHTIAANYPEEPSFEEKALMLNFLYSFAYFYPCSYCAQDFQESLSTNPPKCVQNISSI